MKPLARVSSVEAEWTFVSVKSPCKVCGGHDGCRHGFSDEFACCTRMSSEWPLTAGGWVHRLAEAEVEAESSGVVANVWWRGEARLVASLET